MRACVVILKPHYLQVTSKSKKKHHLGLNLDSKVEGAGGQTWVFWWFPWFFWQCKASHCLERRNPNSCCFPFGPDLILLFSQQNVIIFCIDGPAFLKEIKHVSTVNIRWCQWCSRSTIIGVLERYVSQNCFSSLWSISDGWTHSAVRNLIAMRCSTLTHFLFTHFSCRA